MPDQYLNFDIEAFDYHKDGAGGERFSVRMTEPPWLLLPARVLADRMHPIPRLGNSVPFEGVSY